MYIHYLFHNYTYVIIPCIAFFLLEMNKYEFEFEFEFVMYDKPSRNNGVGQASASKANTARTRKTDKLPLWNPKKAVHICRRSGCSLPKPPAK